MRKKYCKRCIQYDEKYKWCDLYKILIKDIKNCKVYKILEKNI